MKEKFTKRELIQKIKEKKEFVGLSEMIVEKELDKYLKTHRIVVASLIPSTQKMLVKEIRSLLRYAVGQYQASQKNREKLLAQGNILGLLRSHTSTAERLSLYPELRSRIKSLGVTSILDLGCGLNPIALASKEYVYAAADIRLDELHLVKKFFDQNNLSGKTFVHDLTDTSRELPSADLCLVFKVLDIVSNKRDIAEHLLLGLSCRYLLISFSTRKISGRRMNEPRRKWCESLLEKHRLKYTTFSSDNEIFYLVTLRNK